MSATISATKNIPEEIELDRSDWEFVTFGNAAIKQNTAVDRDNMDVSRYIAGEHMGSEDLHLRQWGEVGEDYLGPAFTRSFSKADILYGSRRTYLRKVAVAHFDGVTANTTFVIKANQDLILPDLLPFVMLSEGFAQHSIRNSKGSVNPYINWKDISNYEFLLPPKDQQAKLAELLWTADAAVEKIQRVSAAQSATRIALMTEVFSSSEATVPIGDVIKLSSGKARPKDLADNPVNDHVVPVYGGNGIIGYSTDSILDDPTVILGRVGEYCGVVHDSHGPSWISDNALYVKEWLRPIDRIYVSRFLEFLDLNKQQTGGGQPLITQSLVCSNMIPIPTPAKIADVASRFAQLEATGRDIKNQENAIRQIMRSLINQIF